MLLTTTVGRYVAGDQEAHSRTARTIFRITDLTLIVGLMAHGRMNEPSASSTRR